MVGVIFYQLQLHYFISLEASNTQKREVFLLRISSGNLNASGVVTCQYPQIYQKILKKRKTSLFVLFEVLPTGLLQNIYELWLVHDLNELIVCQFFRKNINEEVAEVDLSQVFSLRHQIYVIF